MNILSRKASGGLSQAQLHVLRLYRGLLRVAKTKDESVRNAIQGPSPALSCLAGMCLGSTMLSSFHHFPVLPSPPSLAASFRRDQSLPRKSMMQIDFCVRKAEKTLVMLKADTVRGVSHGEALKGPAAPSPLPGEPSVVVTAPSPAPAPASLTSASPSPLAAAAARLASKPA